jgi:CBS domain-containing protein
VFIHEVMSTDLVKAKKTDTVRSAVVKMIDRDCGAIPVVEGNNQLIGMVSVRDVLLPLYPKHGDSIIPDVTIVFNVFPRDDERSQNFVEMEAKYPEALGRKVEGIMSPHPLTVAPNDPILEAALYMSFKNLRRIPVVDKGTLVGIVSISDINRGLFFKNGVGGMSSGFG